MYSVERTEYGVRIDLGGDLTVDELEEFNREMKEINRSLDEGFGVVADLRGLSAIPDEGTELITDVMAHSQQQGFGRSAVIVDNPIRALQQEQFGEDVGVESDERVIDATEVDDWESQALDWVKNGIEPDG